MLKYCYSIKSTLTSIIFTTKMPTHPPPQRNIVIFVENNQSLKTLKRSHKINMFILFHYVCFLLAPEVARQHS